MTSPRKAVKTDFPRAIEGWFDMEFSCFCRGSVRAAGCDAMGCAVVDAANFGLVFGVGGEDEDIRPLLRPLAESLYFAEIAHELPNAREGYATIPRSEFPNS
jgi:hypothetical protein